MNSKTAYRIWDKVLESYVTLGSYRKKHTWLVFPWEAIRANKLENKAERYEVHLFELSPSKKFNLKKELI